MRDSCLCLFARLPRCSLSEWVSVSEEWERSCPEKVQWKGTPLPHLSIQMASQTWLKNCTCRILNCPSWRRKQHKDLWAFLLPSHYLGPVIGWLVVESLTGQQSSYSWRFSYAPDTSQEQGGPLPMALNGGSLSHDKCECTKPCVCDSTELIRGTW